MCEVPIIWMPSWTTNTFRLEILVILSGFAATTKLTVDLKLRFSRRAHNKGGYSFRRYQAVVSINSTIVMSIFPLLIYYNIKTLNARFTHLQMEDVLRNSTVEHPKQKRIPEIKESSFSNIPCHVT